MTALEPIETRYKGYRFRSRLEARWAVFFDAQGIKWEYEPQGYDFGELGCSWRDKASCRARAASGWTAGEGGGMKRRDRRRQRPASQVESCCISTVPDWKRHN